MERGGPRRPMSDYPKFGEHFDEAITDQLEAGGIERFDHVIERAFAQEGLADFGVGAGADDEDRDGGIFAAHDAEERERANSPGVRHGDIERDQRRCDDAKEVERLQGIFGLSDDFATNAFEMMAQDVADEHGIIDHQDTHRHHRTTLASPARNESVPRVPFGA